MTEYTPLPSSIAGFQFETNFFPQEGKLFAVYKTQVNKTIPDETLSQIALEYGVNSVSSSNNTLEFYLLLEDETSSKLVESLTTFVEHIETLGYTYEAHVQPKELKIVPFLIHHTIATLIVVFICIVLNHLSYNEQLRPLANGASTTYVFTFSSIYIGLSPLVSLLTYQFVIKKLSNKTLRTSYPVLRTASYTVFLSAVVYGVMSIVQGRELFDTYIPLSTQGLKLLRTYAEYAEFQSVYDANNAFIFIMSLIIILASAWISFEQFSSRKMRERRAADQS